MENIIFLDSSIFISNNYFASELINQLFFLARKKQVEIFITDVVEKEITKNIKESYELISNCLKKNNVWKNIHLSEIPFLIEKHNKIVDETVNKLSQLVSNDIIKIIKTSNSINDKLLKLYFENKVPFNNKKKKNEFLDGFILLTIEEWCIKNAKKVVLFSEDPDILNYTCKHFTVSKNLSEFVESFINKEEIIQELPVSILIERLLELNILEIQNQITYLFENEFQVSLHPSIKDISSIKVKKIDYLKHHIISFDDKKAFVEYTVKIEYEFEEVKTLYNYEENANIRNSEVIVPFELRIDITKGVTKGGYSLIKTDVNWTYKNLWIK